MSPPFFCITDGQLKMKLFEYSYFAIRAPKFVGLLAVALLAANPLFPAFAQDVVQVLGRGTEGVEVSLGDVVAELQRAPQATRDAIFATPESVQQLVNNLLVRRALAKEAERDKVSADPVVAAAVRVASDRVLSDARLLRLDAQNAPGAQAMEAYARSLYKANTPRFERPEQTRAHHILLANTGADSFAKAKELLEQLRKGESFEDAARKYSTDPSSAPRGGDLGFFGDGRMVRPFEVAVTALTKPGDISEPVESQFGYHLIRLDERRPKGVQSFEEVKAQLLEEARVALLSDARVAKVQSLNQTFQFDQEAIKSLGKASSPAK